MSTVKLRYFSMKNISFKGTYDTQIPWSEWDEMTPAEQDDQMDDALRRLVDIDVIDE